MIFQSERTFQVWRYSVSHATLLLRSTRTAAQPTRIDLIFSGVRRMLLQPTFDGITVALASAEERDAAVRRVGGDWGDRELYLLDPAAANFVASAPPAWHEDEGSYSDPSYFQSMLFL
ncbi:hypothetical protein ACWT_6622 [Actinoplanes sp. SE50]|uniref:hypothetical protein n=1 Tax=unclassified Actinoplanes TaxID=2626549 RepID=UPI00023EC87A|nr:MULTISPECIES: hypothetical protein [unclassified Actinoplanes]AEV87634.1 hypothetical protein ACPL_6752 [Actinoplanes sp. SE50/110]ATO86037.1 hypothetical protein ACWT_6622 [Actinoplanes sp. SE50]SLM03451.1 hypothetical protein ACSP50_6740 [Actinoplanes sp. SE50/110]